MSTENDVARSLRSWLREDRHEDADRVLDAVFDQVPATPQRRAGWLARRFPPMNNTIRIGIAAAAVVVLTIVGWRFLPGPSVSEPPRFASTAELTGPWRAVPLAIEPGVAAELDQACRRDPDFPPAVALVAIDARGDGRLIAQYAGPNETADCAFGRISLGGTVSAQLSGTGAGMAAPSPGELSIASYTGGTPLPGRPLEPGAWGWVSGRAGQGIARVGIEILGRVDITASLQNGWFIAWWPAAIGDSVTLTGFDASGAELVRQPIP
jgi:hypothetical protein